MNFWKRWGSGGKHRNEMRFFEVGGKVGTNCMEQGKLMTVEEADVILS